jgi:hypothetical protein
MLTTDFFKLVLPPEGHGYYCATELSSPRKEHRFVETLAELGAACADFTRDKRDTYFALSTFKERAKRTAANSAFIKCFFADIDVGDAKGYADVELARRQFEVWLRDFGFHVPLVVSSGGGLHLYWPFVDPVPVEEWKPYADALKRLFLETGLRIDVSVTADSARVLRAPGSVSFKYATPRGVYVEDSTNAKNFSEYTRLLEPYLEKEVPRRTASATKVAPAPDSILDAPPAFATEKPSFAFNAKLAEITESRFDTIQALGKDGCGQINYFIENAASGGMEPLWRAVISIAKYCVEGEDKAYELSALHPYDAHRTAKKLRDLSGPFNCNTIEALNPGICEKCRHKGKIKSPIALGRDLKAPAEQKEVEVQVGNFTQKHTYPEPHNNFSLSDYGVAFKWTEDGIPRTALIADTPIYASATYDRAGERWVQFIYVEHGTAKSAVLPMAVSTAREESIKAFSKLGVLINNGYDNQFRAYIKSTIAQAKKLPPLHMPTSLGWQADDSFAFDNRVFSTSGEKIVPMYGFENIAEAMGCKGTLDEWRRIAMRVTELERPDITSMMLLGFAAPLMRFTGLNGVTFHLCGNDSGRGKTLCQRLASSVWGNPDKFRITPNTSPVAMINRMGMLGNLPLLVDEITHKGRNEAEWFPEFLSQMSDGRGKERMESQTNSERRNTTSWASIALMTSNKHMMDYLTAERSHGSEGELRRMIELVFDRPLELDPYTKDLLFTKLPENYGVAGEAYARFLSNNVAYVQETVRAVYSQTFDAFEASGDERFWIAGCACIIASARFVAQTGILPVKVSEIAEFLMKAVQGIRAEVRGAKRDATDVLNAFTKRNYGKIVVVNGTVARISGIEVAETLDRSDLCGRVEKRHDGWIDYYIEEREIKAFCSSMSYGYNEFRRDIAAYSPMKRMKKDILAGTRGPMMLVNCIHIKQKGEAAERLFQKAANE